MLKFVHALRHNDIENGKCNQKKMSRGRPPLLGAVKINAVVVAVPSVKHDQISVDLKDLSNTLRCSQYCTLFHNLTLTLTLTLALTLNCKPIANGCTERIDNHITLSNICHIIYIYFVRRERGCTFLTEYLEICASVMSQ